jgi:hypothetical protein
MLENECGEPLLDILLECPDQTARSSIGDLFRFLASSVKMIEKDDL